MKDKILMLIIGILIGAIVTAGVFLLFNKNSEAPQMEGGKEFGEKPDMENRIMDENMVGPRQNKQGSTTNSSDSSSSNEI